MPGIRVDSRGRSAPAPRAARPHPLGAGEAPWIVLLPCTVALLIAIAVAGPWLGTTFMAPTDDVFWPSIAWTVIPESEEHGRYVVALLGPLLLAGASALMLKRGLSRLDPNAGRVLARTSEALALAFVVVCVVAQHRFFYGADYLAESDPFQRAYFTVPTLVFGGVFAVVLAVVLHRPRATDVASRLLRETPARARVAAIAAAFVVATWLLTAVVFESSAGNTNWAVVGNILWSMNETYAVLNGSGPLTDFHSQYGQLWPYAIALPMTLLGPSTGVYTVVAACIDAAALLAVFAILRRAARSSVAALLLFVPFVATSFFAKQEPLDDRYAPSNLLSLWPVRYAGPFLLAWLVTRHVDGAAPRRVTLLFLAAGVVAINNLEFGLGALAATVAALVWTRPPRSWHALARFAGRAASGLGGAVVLVALLTLAVAGQLPRFDRLLEFPRLYGLDGWAMAPIPTLGLHLVLYGTFCAAIVVATVRSVRGDAGDALTAMLVWSGVFGLTAGSYYAGRSHPEVLIDMFATWAFALVLLVVVAVRAILARPSRRPTPGELAVLAGFGVAICSIAQTPTPWSQVGRLRDTAAERIVEQPGAVRFVAASTVPGERVAILTPLSHRVAYDSGVVNVSPYSGIESMPTVGQLGIAIDALRASGGRQLFTSNERTLPETAVALRRSGFAPVAEDPMRLYTRWVDRRR